MGKKTLTRRQIWTGPAMPGLLSAGGLIAVPLLIVFRYVVSDKHKPANSLKTVFPQKCKLYLTLDSVLKYIKMRIIIVCVFLHNRSQLNANARLTILI